MSAAAVTTHVLDTALGRPAAGVPVSARPAWTPTSATIARRRRDRRRRPVRRPRRRRRLEPGTYRLRFDTAAYFAATGQVGFFPEVSITFALTDPGQHYHVPLLLSPFAYSTYRGS